MKLFSIRDLPAGRDAADLVPAGAPTAASPRGFVQAGIRYYARGEESADEAHGDWELALVVMQGRARLVVDGVEHPVAAGDVVFLRADEPCRLCADEVDPAVVLTIGARA